MLAFKRGLCLFASALLLTQPHAVGKAPVSQQNQTQPNSAAGLIHSVDGRDLYRAYCASCHGVDAHGGGPAAPAFKARVPDLTLIARANGGVFPYTKVSRIISGEESPVPHGSREMPVWGPVFHQVETDQDWGNVRLRNLTEYLESLQQK